MKIDSTLLTTRRTILQSLTGLALAGWPLRALAGSPADDEARRSERKLLHHPVSLDELQALPGEAALSGKARVITILNLWAVECRPCVEEMPLLRQAANSYAQRTDLRLLLASETEDDRVLQLFLAKQREQMPTRGLYKLGPDSRLRAGLAVNNQPLTLLLDEQLVIRQAFIGTLKSRRSEFDNAVDRLARSLRQEPANAPSLPAIDQSTLQQAGLRSYEDALLHCRYKRQDTTPGRLFVIRVYDPEDASGAAEEQQMKVRQAAFRSWDGVRFLYVRQPGSPLLTLLLDGQSIIRQVFIGPLASRANEFAEGMNWLNRALRGKAR